MTPIEEKSLNTQVILLSDIESNNKTIQYYIEQKGNELRTLLSQKIISEDMKNVSFTKETFDKILDIAYIIQDKNNWNKISSSVSKALIENEIKKEILNKLK